MKKTNIVSSEAWAAEYLRESKEFLDLAREAEAKGETARAAYDRAMSDAALDAAMEVRPRKRK